MFPPIFDADTVPIVVNAVSKRTKLGRHLRFDGPFMKPIAVVRWDTADADLAILGIADLNCSICHEPNGLIDREFSEDWLMMIFLTHLKSKREATAYSGSAMLTFDG
jgi:hypothetical protein